MEKNTHERNRVIYILLVPLLVVCGLLSRSSFPLPEIFRVYGGDTLWAMLVYYLIAIFLKNRKPHIIGLLSLSFSYFIELSQLYHAPWLDMIRNTTFGALVLGFGFLWSDLVCYTVGVGAALVSDLLIYHYNQKGCCVKPVVSKVK